MKKHIFLLLVLCLLNMAGCGAAQDRLQAPPEAGGGTEPVSGKESSFEVHYMDVGQADAALVLCDGKSMLIDGGNRGDSGLVYSYLKERKIGRLDYIVCTHPHEDHAGGLAGALNYADVGVAFAPVADYDGEAFRDFRKYLEKQGVPVTVPTAGDTFLLGSASVSVAGPTGAGAGETLNNTSIVLRIAYGDTSFLFMGDAEREEEQAILESGIEIRSTVLKAGHHGGATSTTYPFLREAAPEYAVISVGEGNSYGHPAEDVLSRLRDADVEVFRTDIQGTIVCVSDGKQVRFESGGRGSGEAALLEAEWADGWEGMEPDADYILNLNSGKFHRPDCQSVFDMKEANRQYFLGDRKELEEMGYLPCGRCRP